MAKWYDPWLTENERKHLQVGQKGIRARQRMKQSTKNPVMKLNTNAPAKQVNTAESNSGNSSSWYGSNIVRERKPMTSEERTRQRRSSAQRIREGFGKR